MAQCHNCYLFASESLSISCITSGKMRLNVVLSIYYLYMGHELLKDSFSIFIPFQVTANASCGHREIRDIKRLVESHPTITHPWGCTS